MKPVKYGWWIPAAAVIVLATGCGRSPEGGRSEPGQPGQISLAQTSRLTVEAENPDAETLEPPMVIEDNPDASGGKCLAVLEGAGNPGKGAGADKTVFGKADYSVEIPAQGKYIFWARAFWNDACGNSVRIAVDDGNSWEFNDSVYQKWHWVKGSVLELSPGKHKIVIYNREDGAKLDEFLLTTDAGYWPTGLE